MLGSKSICRVVWRGVVKVDKVVSNCDLSTYPLRRFILGGARSGKSRYAEQLATELARTRGQRVVVIATAQPDDEEMQARIAHHQQQRPHDWITIEEPIQLGAALAQVALEHGSTAQECDAGVIILVDCLTVWLSNLLFSEARDYPEIGHIEPPACFAEQRAHLLEVLSTGLSGSEVILVSNEVGQGIIPQGAVSRWFVDEAGRLNQAVAAICNRVILVVAGLPLVVKG